MKTLNRIYTIRQNWNRTLHPPNGGYEGTVSTPLGIVLVEQHTYIHNKKSWSILTLIAMRGNRQYIRKCYDMKNPYTKRGLSIISNRFIKEIFKD